MAITTNGISTEGEAKSKIGSTSSVETNKAIIKSRVYDIGGFVINEENYAYNQCVKYADISVGTQMRTYYLHDNLTVPYTIKRSSNPLTYRDDCVRSGYSSYTELYNTWNNYDTTYKFEYNTFPYCNQTFIPSPTISPSIFNYELLLFSGYTDQNKFSSFLQEYPTFLGQTESDINDPVSMEFKNFNYASLGLLNIYADAQGGMLFNDYDGTQFKNIGVNMKCAQEFSIIVRTGINDNREEAHNKNSIISIFFLIDDPNNGGLKYIKYDLYLDMFSGETSHADVSDVIYLAYDSNLNNIYVTTDYNNPSTICKISYGQYFMPGGYYPPGSIHLILPFYKIILKFTKIKQKYNNAKIRNYYITDIYIPHNTKEPLYGSIKLLYDYANYYKLCNAQMHVQPVDNKNGYGPLDTCAMYNIGMTKGFDFNTDSLDLDKCFGNRIISKEKNIEIIEQEYNSGTAYDTTGFGIINADYCVPNDKNGKRLKVDGTGMYSMPLLTLYYRRAPVLIDWTNRIMGQDNENYSMYPYESLLKVNNDYWKMRAGDLDTSVVGINFDPIVIDKALSAVFKGFALRENVPYILFPFSDLDEAFNVIVTWIKYAGTELKVDFKELLIEFGKNNHGYFIGIPEYLFFMIDGQPLNALTAISSPACIQVALRLTNFLRAYNDVSKIEYPEYIYVYYKTYFYKYITH